LIFSFLTNKSHRIGFSSIIDFLAARSIFISFAGGIFQPDDAPFLMKLFGEVFAGLKAA